MASHSAVTDLRSIEATAERALSPPPDLRVSQWAEQNRILPPTAAAAGQPWRNATTPYLVEIMDCLSWDSPIQDLTNCKGTQTGGSEVGYNWAGYTMDVNPGMMMIVNPGEKELARVTQDRINPMIRETKTLQALAAKARSRDGGNSTFRKDFRGGVIQMVGAQSASGLAATAARDLIFDQVDQYPLNVEGEGDPIAIAQRRQTTFRNTKKTYRIGTPTIEGKSRIWASLEAGDFRRYYVPCKSCGAKDYLRWEDIKWPPDHTEKAGWMCPSCGTLHREADKPAMLAGGEWRPTKECDPRIRSYHIPGMLSPWERWSEQAADFLKAKKDPDLMRVWVNLVLGECYQEQGEVPEWERIYERREDYPVGSVADGALLLTAGADVQADRIEVEVVGWGRDRQSWSVEYRVIPGETDDIAGPAWRGLQEMLDETWPRANGVQMQLRRLAVDEGYNTMHVRSWARLIDDRARVLVCKGTDSEATPLGLPRAQDITLRGKRQARGMQVWPIGSSLLKGELYRWLRLLRPTDEDLEAGEGFAPGYCHFPQYDGEHFKRLTAEQRVRRTVRGYTRYQWEKVYERNEPLDCRVLARAAAIQAGVDRWNERSWDALEEALGGPVAPGDEPRVVGASSGKRRRGVVRTIHSSYARGR